MGPFETVILRQLNDLPIEPKSEQEVRNMCENPMRKQLEKTLDSVPRDKSLTLSAEQSYQAFIGYYNGNLKRIKMSKEALVRTANEYANVLGLTEQPALFVKTIRKMGYVGVPGLATKKFVQQQKPRGK